MIQGEILTDTFPTFPVPVPQSMSGLHLMKSGMVWWLKRLRRQRRNIGLSGSQLDGVPLRVSCPFDLKCVSMCDSLPTQGLWRAPLLAVPGVLDADVCPGCHPQVARHPLHQHRVEWLKEESLRHHRSAFLYTVLERDWMQQPGTNPTNRSPPFTTPKFFRSVDLSLKDDLTCRLGPYLYYEV